MTCKSAIRAGMLASAALWLPLAAFAQDASPTAPAQSSPVRTPPSASATPAQPLPMQPAAAPPAQNDAAKPAPEMQAVLDKLQGLQVKSFAALTVPEARMQASAADAALAVQWDKRISSNPEAQVTTKDIKIPSKTGGMAARVYIPGGDGPFPVVVNYHGGGWVVADINTYDAAPKALAMGVHAVVVSVEYRHAPEHKFPAAHRDAWTAYKWIVENVHTLNGNSDKIAVAGESAGGNLAANVALMAKEMKTKQPVHQLLVYPVAGSGMNTDSYKEQADAKPLGKADMEWFVRNSLSSRDQASDKRLNLVDREDLAGVAPATVITAQFDPLRSEGQAYAEKLKAAGVNVDAKTFDGVTHEFFGMGKVVPQAKAAMDMAVADLIAAFDKAQ